MRSSNHGALTQPPKTKNGRSAAEPMFSCALHESLAYIQVNGTSRASQDNDAINTKNKSLYKASILGEW